MPGDIIFALSVQEQANPFVVVHIILTVNNSAQEFVILSVFAVHLTDDLNPRSPVYSIFHVC